MIHNSFVHHIMVILKLLFILLPLELIKKQRINMEKLPLMLQEVPWKNSFWKTNHNKGFTNLVYVSSRLTGTFQVPSYITSIGNSAFRCSKFNNIIFSKNVTFIDSFCLGICQIVEFEFPIKIKTIPSFMFQNCPNLG